MDIYTDAPTCYIKSCLLNDTIYCMADCHNITPNETQCEKSQYIELD